MDVFLTVVIHALMILLLEGSLEVMIFQHLINHHTTTASPSVCEFLW